MALVTLANPTGATSTIGVNVNSFNATVTVGVNGSSAWIFISIYLLGSTGTGIATITDGTNTWRRVYQSFPTGLDLPNDIEIWTADDVPAGGYVLVCAMSGTDIANIYSFITFEVQSVQSPSYGGAGASQVTPGSPVDVSATGPVGGIMFIFAVGFSAGITWVEDSGNTLLFADDAYPLPDVVAYAQSTGGLQPISVAYTLGSFIEGPFAVAVYTAGPASPPAAGPLYSGL